MDWAVWANFSSFSLKETPPSLDETFTSTLEDEAVEGSLRGEAHFRAMEDWGLEISRIVTNTLTSWGDDEFWRGNTEVFNVRVSCWAKSL